MNARSAALVLFALGAPLLGACRSPSAPLLGRSSESAGGAYEIDFVGNRAFSDSELQAAIADNLVDFRRSKYGKAAIDDAAYELEQLYRDAGFAQATADYEVDTQRKRVRLLLEEGPRIRLGRVEIRGAIGGRRRSVRQLVSVRRTGQDWYSEAGVQRAASSIAGWYRSLGFLDVRVEIADLAIANGKASLTIVVSEGVPSRLNAVFFSGPLVFDEAELARIVETDLDQPYTPRRAARMLGVVEGYHADRGYPDVEVELSELERSEQGAVNLALVIRPGPLVRLAEVRVEGAEKTREPFIRSRLTLEKGDVYSAEAKRKSFRALYASGLFSRIEMELHGEGEQRTLVVHVTEDWSRDLFIEPGWGAYDRLRLRGGFRERNFLGTGRIARLEGLVSEFTTNARIGLTDPWFFDTDIIADASLVYTRRQEPSFEYQDVGLDLSLLKRWSIVDTASVTYLYRRSDLLSEDINSNPLESISEDIGISSIRLGQLRDTRNQFVIPSAGHRSEYSLEWADELIGSELDFLRGAVSFAGYKRLSERTVLAASARTGVIQPTGNTTSIPLQERYFNGGENTVRSYAESQLGPKDASGNPTGGETFTVFTLELRQDLSKRIEGALFVDAGNVSEQVTDYLEFNDYGYAIGVGLRYVLPVGPLRLDLGVNPSPEPGDADYTLHFSVGRAF